MSVKKLHSNHNDAFDVKIKSKLEDFAATPPPMAWDNIAAQVQSGPRIATKIGTVYRRVYSRVMTVAAVLVLTFILGLSFYFNGAINNERFDQLVEMLPYLPEKEVFTTATDSVEQQLVMEDVEIALQRKTLTNQTNYNKAVLMAALQATLKQQINEVEIKLPLNKEEGPWLTPDDLNDLNYVANDMASIKSSDLKFEDKFYVGAKTAILGAFVIDKNNEADINTEQQPVSEVPEMNGQDFEFNAAPGYNFGVALGYNFTNALGIQSEIMRSRFSQNYFDKGGSGEKGRLNLRYVHIPVMFRYHFDNFKRSGVSNRIALNTLLGVQYGYLTGATQTVEGGNPIDLELDNIKNHDFSFLAGIETDISLTQRLVFSVGARANLGAQNSVFPQLVPSTSVRPDQYNLVIGVNAGLKFTPTKKKRK